VYEYDFKIAITVESTEVFKEPIVDSAVGIFFINTVGVPGIFE
jgi:hypothetical protein